MHRIIVWVLTVGFTGAAAVCGVERGEPLRAEAQESLADTEANRAAQAARYLEAVPVRELFRDVAENMAKTMPAAEARTLEEVFTEHIDFEVFEDRLASLLVKHFSADELRALADFYGSPVGKSAMAKFGAYMADAMPLIQEQVTKALAKSKGRK